METKSFPIARNTAYGLLQKCLSTKDIGYARHIQSLLIFNGLQTIAALADHIIRVFASCGSVIETNQAFHTVPTPSAYTWSAIISASNNFGQYEQALQLYDTMQSHGIRGNIYVYVAVIKACSITASIAQGRMVHNHLIKNGLDVDIAIANTLVDMYARCSCLNEALKVFDDLPEKNVVSWSIMIAGYVHNGQNMAALGLLNKMQQEDIKPNNVTYLSLIKACAKLEIIGESRLMHNQILKCRIEIDLFIGSALVDMYVKCMCMDEAQKTFYKLQHKNVISWGSIIAGYAQHGLNYLAINYFDRMQQEGITPERVTFSSALKACGCVGAICHGRLLHSQVIITGNKSDVMIGSSLVTMYCKCESLQEAHDAFEKTPSKDLISWSVLIIGYIHHGHDLLALELFSRMRLENVEPDEIITSSILRVCGNVGFIHEGRLVHSHICETEHELDVIGNSLIDMYAKCGSLMDAMRVFIKVKDEGASVWGVMIAGYVQHGHNLLALELFEEMQQDNTKLEKTAVLSILKACGNVGAIEQGRMRHVDIIQSESYIDVVTGNILIDMYAKCGSLKEAREVFNLLQDPNVVSWDTMISGYIRDGSIQLAREYIGVMQLRGIKPNDVTFTIFLSACSHAGLVDEGLRCFQSMEKDYGIIPDACHYTCMVDLLGRAGFLNEAEYLLHTMEPNIIGWTSLLTACRIHYKLGLGRHCFNKIIKLDPTYGGAYVLISNLYADNHIWEVSGQVEKFALASNFA